MISISATIATRVMIRAGPAKRDKIILISLIKSFTAHTAIFAIILHLGRHMAAGHYICIIKRDKRWYVCDDETVKEIDEEQILNENAYLLFYRQDNN